ncbi:MAG: hypothetical protein U5N10_06245 [Gemmobacter sp.]|nr:hypothetical protein [Gemmobacter sp.]
MSLSATAQREKRQNVNPEQRAEMTALRMKQKLGLSEEQHKKVEALNKSKAAEMLKKTGGDESPKKS